MKHTEEYSIETDLHVLVDRVEELNQKINHGNDVLEVFRCEEERQKLLDLIIKKQQND